MGGNSLIGTWKFEACLKVLWLYHNKFNKHISIDNMYYILHIYIYI